MDLFSRSVLIFKVLLAASYFDNVHSGTCKTGHGYPSFCPRSTDPSNYTKCCKYYYQPMCCLERANNVCSRGGGSKRSGGDYDPPLDWAAVFCPQPNEPDDHTVCYYRNDQLGCSSVKVLGGIMGGVFGGLFLIGMVILISCCILFKTGYCVCVKVGPNKYTCLTRKKAEAYTQRLQQLHIQQRQQQQASTQFVAPGYAQPYTVYSQTPPPYPAPQLQQNKV